MKEILISSSVLILVLTVLRWLLNGRVSRRLQYGLWLVVALRLLIPVQFGHSDYSVATFTEQAKPIQQVEEALHEPIAGPSREELYDQYLSDYLTSSPTTIPVIPPVPSPSPDNVTPPQSTTPPNHAVVPTPTVTPNPVMTPDVTVSPEVQIQIEAKVEENIKAPTLSEILRVVWIGGMVIMSLWFLWVNLAFAQKAKKNSTPWEGAAPVRVKISPDVSSPCLTGLLRPVIYLTPASTENENSLNHVLTHELTHLHHWDHVWSMVRCLCLCVYWFDPLVWLAAILSKRDCELACDEAALEKLGDSQRIPYGKTLLAIVSQSPSPAHILETATAMNETKKQLKERVNCIVKKPRNFLIAAVCLILTAAIVTGCAFAGSKPTEKPTPSAADPTDPTDAIEEENEEYRVTINSPEPLLNVVEPYYEPGKEVTIQLDRTAGQRYALSTNEAELSLPHSDHADPTYVYYTFIMPAQDVTVNIEIIASDDPTDPPVTAPPVPEPPVTDPTDPLITPPVNSDGYMLIINHQEIKGTRIAINEDHLYAEVPLFYILQQLDIPVQWQNETTAVITAWDKDYILDTANGTLLAPETGFNVFAVPPGAAHEVFYQGTGNDFVIDSDSASWFFQNVLGGTIIVDHETKFVSFYYSHSNIPEETAQEIAENLIDRFNMYSAYGVCCDYEHSFDDMTEYLSDTQKADYIRQQIRLLCCDTREEAQSHIRQYLSDELAGRDLNRDLFFDGEGNLYALVPEAALSYHGVRCASWGSESIVAYADCYADGYDHSVAFQIKKIDGQWMIVNEYLLTPEFDSTNPPVSEPDSTVPPVTEPDIVESQISDNGCTLLVNGKDISAGNYIAFNEESHYVELPFLAIMRELGADVQWQDDSMVSITIQNTQYLLDTANAILIEEEDFGKTTDTGMPWTHLLVPPGCDHGLNHRVIGDEFIIDSCSLAWFFPQEISVSMFIDRSEKVITVNWDPEV